jgi:hypothetical protein
MPRHLCRQLGIRMITYLREAYILPILITAPLFATLLLMQLWYQPHTYRGLALQLVIAGVVYGLGLLWVFKTNRAFRVGELAPRDAPGSVGAAANSPVEAFQEDV